MHEEKIENRKHIEEANDIQYKCLFCKNRRRAPNGKVLDHFRQRGVTTNFKIRYAAS